jgi:hypothetical protein
MQLRVSRLTWGEGTLQNVSVPRNEAVGRRTQKISAANRRLAMFLTAMFVAVRAFAESAAHEPQFNIPEGNLTDALDASRAVCRSSTIKRSRQANTPRLSAAR